jgi:Putative peptidoglycan binding domain
MTKMKLKWRVSSAVLLSFLALLAACAEKTSQHVADECATPDQYTFSVSYEKAWQETVRAVSEEGRISKFERESGLIVTEHKNINKYVQTLNHTSMFGKIFKNSYTIHLTEVSLGQTRISIRSNLQLEQITSANRECADDWIKRYMRQELFRKICINLKSEGKNCTSIFPDCHKVSVSCQTQEMSPAMQTAVLPRVGTAKALSASVKEVQRALINAGYEPGPVDGRMGQKTRAAIRRFQQDKGVDSTGSIDWATMKALGL